MTQVSKRPLDKDVYSRIFEIFITAFIEINNKEKAEKFLTEIFSETEQIMIAKRLAIAFLLTKKYSFEAINKMLKVSVSTICRVNSSVKKEKSAYAAILQEVEKHLSQTPNNSLSYILGIIETLLPPARGTNWKEERKKQYKKLQEIENSKKPF